LKNKNCVCNIRPMFVDSDWVLLVNYGRTWLIKWAPGGSATRQSRRHPAKRQRARAKTFRWSAVSKQTYLFYKIDFTFSI
jgi:hypothetical protein